MTAKFFVCGTGSGTSVISYDDLSAVTSRSVGSSIRYDIHLKSGTIFTTSKLPGKVMELFNNAD